MHFKFNDEYVEDYITQRVIFHNAKPYECKNSAFAPQSRGLAGEAVIAVFLLNHKTWRGEVLGYSLSPSIFLFF
jgi:hypothetical protein